jgi:hypothetical protein
MPTKFEISEAICREMPKGPQGEIPSRWDVNDPTMELFSFVYHAVNQCVERVKKSKTGYTWGKEQIVIGRSYNQLHTQVIDYTRDQIALIFEYMQNKLDVRDTSPDILNDLKSQYGLTSSMLDKAFWNLFR